MATRYEYAKSQKEMKILRKYHCKTPITQKLEH